MQIYQNLAELDHKILQCSQDTVLEYFYNFRGTKCLVYLLLVIFQEYLQCIDNQTQKKVNLLV